MQNELLSLVQAAAVVKIDPSMICRWLKNVENLRADPRKASKMAAHARQLMLDQDPNQSIPCPSLALVEEWLIAAQRLMTPAIIRNA